jgi:hypothetical protein
MGKLLSHDSIVPERRLLFKSIWESFLHNESSADIPPVSELPERSNNDSSWMFPKVHGIFPVNWLFPNLSLSRKGEFPSWGGISWSNALFVTSNKRKKT